MPLYMIYAPVGGFGNHLRWLLLLDENYVLTLNGQTITTTVEKINFIKKFVYCNERSWHNWLQFEGQFVMKLNQHLKLTHVPTDVFDDLKTIGVTIDPDLAHRSFVKFNSNGVDKETFLKRTHKQNKFCKFADQCIDTLKYIDLSALFCPVLDETIYKNALTFFNLENHYLEAKEIHALWYNLHLKAETEYVQSQLTI